jgi:putative lumazine-binding protein
VKNTPPFTAHLSRAMTTDRQQIDAVLQTYFDGVYENDRAKIAQAFHECCHLYSVREGKLVDLSRQAWFEVLAKLPSAKTEGQPRHDWIVTVDQSGPATAFAKVNCQLPPRYFTDYLTLAKLAEGWRIVSKTYHTDMR